mgnify:CR=1 FL=1
MELKDRIAAVRKAAGLTQEQLGELLGVTRQAVSKWESGQTTPDAATIAALCEKLHVSADYVLLGKEPREGQTAAYEPPDTCPCCGRKVSGSICPECGYQLPNHPPRGPQYAVVATRPGFVQSTESSAQLVKYCGFTQEDANNAIAHYVNNQSRILLRRGLVDSAAQYIAAHLDQDFFCPQIVVDCGESEEALLYKPKAFETPSPVKSQEGIGFWGGCCYRCPADPLVLLMMDRSFLRRYAASGAVIAGLYLLNRFLLVPLTSCRLLAWHGADFLAGGLMLCLLNGLLCLTRRRPVERALPASLFLLACGLFWEVVTPLYLLRSVGDLRDVLAVWLGGVALLSLWRVWDRLGPGS